MGGRTNNAGDWLTGKTQDQFESQVARRKQSAELLRKSGYTKAIDEKTGEEFDFRSWYLKQNGMAEDNLTEEEWKLQAEQNYLPNLERDPLGQPLKGKPEQAAPRPIAPDATDEALKKTRTAAWNRLQMGKNRSSSMTTQGKLGGFDVGKPVLGGY